MADTKTETNRDKVREDRGERGRATISPALLASLRDHGRSLNERLEKIGVQYNITPPQLRCESEIVNGGTVSWRGWMVFDGRRIAENVAPHLDRCIERTLEDGLHYIANRDVSGMDARPRRTA